MATLSSPGARRGAAVLLVAWAGLTAAARAAAPEQLARGATVAQRFCMSCHPFESARGQAGLRDRLRPEVWPSPEQAYRNLGQLWLLSGAMTFRFEGSEEDRRALAVYLAYVAERNRVSPWRKVLGALPLGAAVVAAALWAHRAVGRGRLGAPRR